MGRKAIAFARGRSARVRCAPAARARSAQRDRNPHRRHAMKLSVAPSWSPLRRSRSWRSASAKRSPTRGTTRPPNDGVSTGPSTSARPRRSSATSGRSSPTTRRPSRRNPEKAVARYGGPVYIQHNPRRPTARSIHRLRQGVHGPVPAAPHRHQARDRRVRPGRHPQPHHDVADDRGQAVADIFRLNRQGKVVEHWDVIQDVPATSANDNAMF